MISNFDNSTDFEALTLDEKKELVNNAIERDVENELRRMHVYIKASLTTRDKLKLLIEKYPESSAFKTISEDLIKIMSVIQNYPIDIKTSKKETIPFLLKGKITHYCSRLNIFPMYTYNGDNQLVKMEMIENIEYSNLAISLFDCFNNRFMVKNNNKILVLK